MHHFSQAIELAYFSIIYGEVGQGKYGGIRS